MEKERIRLTQVYRINGRLVVANSIEGAINTWREWMGTTYSEIVNIEKMCSDNYQCPGQEAIVYAEGLCGDITAPLIEDITTLNQEREKLMYELEKLNVYCNELEERIKSLSVGVVSNKE